MFKRLLSAWLIISTLGYGSAWAFSDHVSDVMETYAVSSDEVKHIADSGDEHPACNHCCHTSAHVIALWSTQSAPAFNATHTGFTPYIYSYYFIPASPPDRPPQS